MFTVCGLKALYVYFQFVLFFNLIQYRPLEFGDYVYPMWANGIGWILSMIPLTFITTIAITKLIHGPKEMSIFQVMICLLLSSTTDLTDS